MRFWESVRIALGMQEKGIAPSSLILKKFTVDGGPVKLEWEGVHEIVNDEVFIAKLVHDCLIDKRVMYVDISAEHTSYVRASLVDLRERLSGYVGHFEDSISSRDRFLATLLLVWRSSAKQAVDSIDTALETEAIDRADWRKGSLIDSEEIAEARAQLPQIMTDFRSASFAPATLLNDLLPDDHATNVEGRRCLARTRAFLETRYADTGKAVPDPSWEIDFQK